MVSRKSLQESPTKSTSFSETFRRFMTSTTSEFISLNQILMTLFGHAFYFIKHFIIVYTVFIFICR